MLFEEVDVENPVYMPVISIGPGIINYYGEMGNDLTNLLTGRPSIRFSAYQELGAKYNFRLNLFVIYGEISGENRSYTELQKNLNFKTEIIDFGLNLEYAFGHLIKGQNKMRPFISIGAEYFTFNSKTDMFLDETGERYHYYPDGTIRNASGEFMSRDYKYETSLRDLNFRDDVADQSAFALVADLGFEVPMSERVTFRIATSLHYSFTDDIDNISSENTNIWVGDAAYDMFSLTYCAINIDLFSDPESIINQRLFADVSGDFDYNIVADTDNDGVLDLMDDCPETPQGVLVNDTTGCPLDDDRDGVPNYKDKEPGTRTGAIINEDGVEMKPDQILKSIPNLVLEPVSRDELYMIPISMGTNRYMGMTPEEIPDKFKSLDLDNDGYISFDELKNAIDAFFDGNTNLSSDDIYELNEFFFAQ